MAIFVHFETFFGNAFVSFLCKKGGGTEKDELETPHGVLEFHVHFSGS